VRSATTLNVMRLEASLRGEGHRWINGTATREWFSWRNGNHRGAWRGIIVILRMVPSQYSFSPVERTAPSSVCKRATSIRCPCLMSIAIERPQRLQDFVDVNDTAVVQLTPRGLVRNGADVRGPRRQNLPFFSQSKSQISDDLIGVHEHRGQRGKPFNRTMIGVRDIIEGRVVKTLYSVHFQPP
jgi:hypothetical protein